MYNHTWISFLYALSSSRFKETSHKVVASKGNWQLGDRGRKESSHCVYPFVFPIMC